MVDGLRNHANCSVLVLCAQPAGEVMRQTSTTNAPSPTTPPLVVDGGQQSHNASEPNPLCVTVSKWYKLDRDSAWEGS
jgi:hypothetical protein